MLDANGAIVKLDENDNVLWKHTIPGSTIRQLVASPGQYSHFYPYWYDKTILVAKEYISGIEMYLNTTEVYPDKLVIDTFNPNYVSAFVYVFLGNHPFTLTRNYSAREP